MNKKNCLILSGGTGGHVIPAISCGNFFIEKGYHCYLFTDQRGKKYTDSFKGQTIIVNSSHFSHNFFGKIKAVILLLLGLFQSIKFIIRIRPSICISFGSYSTFAPLTVLVFFRFFGLTKIFLHEQNSIMGKVNSFFIPFVNKIFLNYKKTIRLKKYYYSNKAIFAGMPIDHNIKLFNRKTEFIKNKKIKILVSGGSQGAISLNKILINLFKKIPKNILDHIQLSVQCPESCIQEINNSLKQLFIDYELKNFFYNYIHKLYKTDILIARGGAGTVNDVIISQIPTIFVPLPSSSNNHQFYNANYLKQKKAAIIIEQKDLQSEQSLSIIIELISNFKKQINLINNLKEVEILKSNKIIFNNIND